MTPNEAYHTYLALKLHFTTDSYDVFKYNWQTKAADYTKRKDKFHFEKLARHPDPIGLLVSNFLVDRDMWVGSVCDQKHSEVYAEWKRRRQGLTYLFSEEIKQLDANSFKVVDGQHPPLLHLYLRRKISPETMVILNHYTQFGKVWNKLLSDDPIWRDVARTIDKYHGFVKWNRSKIRDIMSKHFLDKPL